MLSNLFINSFNVIHPLLFTSTSSIIAWASARDKTLPKLLSELARSSADKSPSRSASKISNNSIQVEDAYGGLLTELQDVRNQISQYVDGGGNANNKTNNNYLNDALMTSIAGISAAIKNTG